MNIAISSILIFLTLVFPGYIYRRFYYNAEFSKQFFKTTPYQVFLASIVPSILFLTLSFLLLSVFIKNLPDFDLITNSSYTPKSIKSSIYIIIISYVLAMFFGYISKLIVRKLKLDRTYKLLRFKNDWHYILSGEIYDYLGQDSLLNNSRVVAVKIDALVSTGNNTFLYRGHLVDYHLNNTSDGLDKLILRDVKRYAIEKNSHKNSINLPKLLILEKENIANLSIAYVTKKINAAEKTNRKNAIYNTIFSILVIIILTILLLDSMIRLFSGDALSFPIFVNKLLGSSLVILALSYTLKRLKNENNNKLIKLPFIILTTLLLAYNLIPYIIKFFN